MRGSSQFPLLLLPLSSESMAPTSQSTPKRTKIDEDLGDTSMILDDLSVKTHLGRLSYAIWGDHTGNVVLTAQERLTLVQKMDKLCAVLALPYRPGYRFSLAEVSELEGLFNSDGDDCPERSILTGGLVWYSEVPLIKDMKNAHKEFKTKAGTDVLLLSLPDSWPLPPLARDGPCAAHYWKVEAKVPEVDLPKIFNSLGKKAGFVEASRMWLVNLMIITFDQITN